MKNMPKAFKILTILRHLITTCAVPGLILTIFFYDLILLNSLKLLLIGWFGVFIVAPLIFRFSYRIQRGLIFLNFIHYPAHLDLSVPESLGLYGTRNFVIKYEDEDKNLVSIAAWHVMPSKVVKRFSKQLRTDRETLKRVVNDIHYHANESDDESNEHRYKVIETLIGSHFNIHNGTHKDLLYEEVLRKTKDPIVLYLHGNTGTRANGHRIELYKKLQKLGYHVIALDYRGFGDSSAHSPTERGCVSDGLSAYIYVKNLTNNPLYVYGHSLGTGIGLHMVSLISKSSHMEDPKGVILESPFNTMKDEITNHPFSALYRWLPWFESTIVRPIYENGFQFESENHISDIRAPVMIMHADNDRVIPLKLGYSLYRKALDTRGKSWGPVEFHRFKENYGHKHIVRAPTFADIVDQFIRRYKLETY